jgi:hypothetical protein
MVKKIELTNGKFTLVDEEDFEYLSEYSWYVYSKNKTREYAGNIDNGYMHRTICFVGMGIDLGEKDVVDHINGDTLDNRRCNLRVVTHRQNSQNRHHTKSSKYPGVCWSTKGKKWASYININNKLKNLGYFKYEEEAFEAYKKAVHELTGELVVCELKGVS